MVHTFDTLIKDIDILLTLLEFLLIRFIKTLVLDNIRFKIRHLYHELLNLRLVFEIFSFQGTIFKHHMIVLFFKLLYF